MPLAHIHVALPLTPEKKKEIAAAASSILSQVICKPESYCMATINEVDGCMGGTFDPFAFILVKSIGGLGRTNKDLSKRFCELMAKHGVAPERVYLNFQDVPASSWGYNGSTFG